MQRFPAFLSMGHDLARSFTEFQEGKRSNGTMEKEGGGEGFTVGEGWRWALTNPAVHDVGLNDGAFPAEVFRHRGTAHLQVFHLQDGPPHLRPLNFPFSPTRRDPDHSQTPFPPTAPFQGISCEDQQAARQHLLLQHPFLLLCLGQPLKQLSHFLI